MCYQRLVGGEIVGHVELFVSLYNFYNVNFNYVLDVPSDEEPCFI